MLSSVISLFQFLLIQTSIQADSLGSGLLLVPGSLIINTGYTNILCLIGLDQSQRRFSALNVCPSRLFRHLEASGLLYKDISALFIDARNEIKENVDRK